MNKAESLYKQLKNKKPFIQAAADKFGVKFGTIKSHWVLGSVPRKYEDEYIALLQEQLKKEKKIAKIMGE